VEEKGRGPRQAGQSMMTTFTHLNPSRIRQISSGVIGYPMGVKGSGHEPACVYYRLGG
jgi:hypothetical protein